MSSENPPAGDAIRLAKDEYSDASNNVRHWSTLRFAQLTIYIALSASLMNMAVSGGGSTPVARLLIKVAGLVVALVFWVLQERTMLYWNHFVRRAAELEPSLGFRQYSARPRAGVLSSTNAMRLFFVVIVLFWVAAFIWFP